MTSSLTLIKINTQGSVDSIYYEGVFLGTIHKSKGLTTHYKDQSIPGHRIDWLVIEAVKDGVL